MLEYLVLRPFDFYRAGDVMRAADVAEQKQRGNMPDLLRNGFLLQREVSEPSEPDSPIVEPVADDVLEVTPDLNDMSKAALVELAKMSGIPYSGKRKAELIAALTDGDN